MLRFSLISVATITLSLTGCGLRSYPRTFVELPPPQEVIELPPPGIRGDYDESWETAMNALTREWDAESGWKIGVSDKRRGYIRTAWRYGYSCYRFGDYRRRIILSFPTIEDPDALHVRTEAERKKRTARILWWGGKDIGWIRGFDPAFQQEVYAELSSRLGKAG